MKKDNEQPTDAKALDGKAGQASGVKYTDDQGREALSRLLELMEEAQQ
ncbi:MAG: hypothetical protein WC516_03765 [Patescibacteria group bacterium]